MLHFRTSIYMCCISVGWLKYSHGFWNKEKENSQRNVWTASLNLAHDILYYFDFYNGFSKHHHDDVLLRQLIGLLSSPLRAQWKRESLWKTEVNKYWLTFDFLPIHLADDETFVYGLHHSQRVRRWTLKLKQRLIEVFNVTVKCLCL